MRCQSQREKSHRALVEGGWRGCRGVEVGVLIGTVVRRWEAENKSPQRLENTCGWSQKERAGLRRTNCMPEWANNVVYGKHFESEREDWGTTLWLFPQPCVQRQACVHTDRFIRNHLVGYSWGWQCSWGALAGSSVTCLCPAFDRIKSLPCCVQPLKLGKLSEESWGSCHWESLVTQNNFSHRRQWS